MAMESNRRTRILKVWWRSSSAAGRRPSQIKMGTTLLLISSSLGILGITNVLWAYKYTQLLNFSNVALDDGRYGLPSLVRRLHEEHDSDRIYKRKLRADLAGGSASLGRPQYPSSSVKLSGDVCRKEVTATITLSVSEFCHQNATAADFDNLPSQFNVMEQNLVPYASLFDENSQVDNKYTVVIVPNVLCQPATQASDITLTTQMSTNKVRRLVALAARWNGPISVAVKVTSIQDLRQFQTRLAEHATHLQKVAFHLYFESRHRVYPINILRNLALDHVQSDYFAVFDVDLLPSPMNTHAHLRSTFDENPQLEDRLNDRTVFVLPAWEIKEEIQDEDITIRHASYPESRTAVLEMNSIQKAEERKIEIFRHVFEPGHRSTNYKKWTSDLTATNEVSYPIKVREYGYEPYIVGAMKGAPRFFGDFRGFGFNKGSYFAELHYAKYSIEVLRDFFIFHVNHPSTYGEEGRTETRKTNMLCIQFFMNYLGTKYGAEFLGKEQEVVGWDIWMRRRAEGLKEDWWLIPLDSH